MPKVSAVAHLPESLDPTAIDGDHVASQMQLLRAIINAQRQAIIAPRDRGEIGDDSLHRIQRDLDLEVVRTEI